jgi:hypothetical protein
MARYKTVSLVLLACLLLAAGCGSSGGSGSPNPPDVTGTVTNVTPPLPDGDVLGSLFITGRFEGGTTTDQVAVAVVRSTRIYREPGGERVSVEMKDISVGSEVEAWFTGPVMESYPPQATASEINILSEPPGTPDTTTEEVTPR